MATDTIEVIRRAETCGQHFDSDRSHYLHCGILHISWGTLSCQVATRNMYCSFLFLYDLHNCMHNAGKSVAHGAHPLTNMLHVTFSAGTA